MNQDMVELLTQITQRMEEHAALRAAASVTEAIIRALNEDSRVVAARALVDLGYSVAVADGITSRLWTAAGRR